mgnify:CR=1 FL=1
MKQYKLTIVYNTQTDEIEFIEESIEDESPDKAIRYREIDITEYFDEESLKLINEAYDCGIS